MSFSPANGILLVERFVITSAFATRFWGFSPANGILLVESTMVEVRVELFSNVSVPRTGFY